MSEPPGLAGLERERDGLPGRRVLVTGGSRGIGRACAAEVLAAGGRVVLAARTERGLRAAADPLAAAHPGRVDWLAADVGQPDDVERLVAGSVERMGGLDGLVHAAAVLGPIGPATEVDAAAWWSAVRVNLLGTFLVARSAARSMVEGGSVVLLSGGGATSPFPNFTAYASGKAAVVRLAETLAQELAPAVRVNALAPGFVATDIHDAVLDAGDAAGAEYVERTRRELAAGGVPPELAGRAAVFLLSDRSRGITGRLLAAPWDAWWEWPERRDRIAGSDLFTLRRIVPRDRGEDWQ